MWLPEPRAATRGRPYKQSACAQAGGRMLGEVRSQRPDSSVIE